MTLLFPLSSNVNDINAELMKTNDLENYNDLQISNGCTMLGNLVKLLVNGSYFSLCVSVGPAITKTQSFSSLV